MEAYGMLAHHFSQFKNTDGWFVSRKLDGHSVLWDGGVNRGKCFKNRGGKTEYHTGLYSLGRSNGVQVINAPDFFLDKLPKDIPLHGELWYNDRTDLIQSLTGSDGCGSPLWSLAMFVPFFVKPYSTWVDEYHHGYEQEQEVMDSVSLDNPFRKNDKSIVEFLALAVEHGVKFIDRGVARGDNKIEYYNELIQSHMWEGLMFLNPYAKYENGRSDNNVKLKPFYETEAEVIGWGEAKKVGKFLGGYSGVKCRMTWDDKILSVYGGTEKMVGKKVSFIISGGIPDYLRLPSGWQEMQNEYYKGKVVNFSYYGVTHTGVPKSCSFTNKSCAVN